jgi:succinoglycan biosynthesis transport protein ExoP
VSAGVRTEFQPGADEQPTDASRYLAALRRGSWLIALIVVPLTATVLVLSLTLPKSYTATASLVLEERSGVIAPADNESATRRLATIRSLLTSRDVLARATGELPGETLTTLEDKVTASVDDVASIIRVEAGDGDAEGAAAIANEVTRVFLDQRRMAEGRRLAEARRELEEALERARASRATDEVQALRERLSELSVSEVAVGDELRVAQPARPPEDPSSPRPLQNTLLAFFAALFVAVLAAVGRDVLAPRVRSPRELTTLTGLTPLVVLPARRSRRSAAETAEAYQALAASLRVQLSDSQRVVLVTGAQESDDRAGVAVGLGRALSSSDVPTLLMSADLRGPGLHKQLGVPQAPGLGNVLESLEQPGDEHPGELIRAVTRAHEHPSRGELRGLPAGQPHQHPAAVLSGDSLGTVFEELGRSEYRYVVVEGPPLLGPIDGQLVARWVDAILVVCRLDRLWPGEAAELGEVLGRLEAPVLGAVVIGGSRVRYALPAWTPRRAASMAPDA